MLIEQLYMVIKGGIRIWELDTIECPWNERFSKKSDTQNLQNCVGALIQLPNLLHNGYQHVNVDGDPDLWLHRAFCGLVEEVVLP